MRNITILGATGSIGTQALEIIRGDRGNFNLLAASANTNVTSIKNIIDEFAPKYITMMDKDSYNIVKDYCKAKNLSVEVLYGVEGLIEISTLSDVDLVLTSLVGMIGLRPTIEAIKAGIDIALANKETLVVGGEIVMDLAKKHKVKILPVDSEHGAIFQCLQGNQYKDIDKILLTASGGPFRGRPLNELQKVDVNDALSHPKWNMGKKISIDSATLINKGLEVIEAKWLFDIQPSNIEVLVHPQSIVHSMVQYKDGSVIAQLSNPDMKLPIQYALNYPIRKASVIKTLNLLEIRELTFEKPDLNTFKGLKLAYDAINEGGNLPTILNSANEVAVELFLNGKISFLDIANIIEQCMLKIEKIRNITLDEILYTEELVRRYIKDLIK
ncbi:1-deoxy-D-xylulose-5-phosphate reductoisomerase [Clostridium cellulovorans]|uniref:1-deoxy-D-xylulose 5-phosphate reductoisomerase n=1 Tax=Clostridium cellulovorans (strain ATCC 35296 / DSM 3052 / OCM 3 / 743B) TaxID=573061 RepID=D9SKM8_CLOC7|nr:1-deoxy-D-xylulose-5-phosphate reductoisomerase [Clostridium cellulovorans]ADL51524.1 1-deoxy-D-xylulose 5-phosphate reductoisomerase [Clostridium cellulovorans 743B]